MLWTLLFLKVYASENVLCKICACDEKTLRKWVWMMLDEMARLDVVSVYDLGLVLLAAARFLYLTIFV